MQNQKVINLIILMLMGLVLVKQTIAQRKSEVLTLRKQDYQQIVKDIFMAGFDRLNEKSAITKGRECLVPIVKNKAVIFLVDEKLDKSWLPIRSDVQFMKISSKEKDDSIKQNQTICYLQLSITARPAAKVTAVISYQFNQQLCSTCIVFARGQAVAYEYEKINGKWKPKFLHQTVFVT